MAVEARFEPESILLPRESEMRCDVCDGFGEKCVNKMG
jgi:hypothetical protein